VANQNERIARPQGMEVLKLGFHQIRKVPSSTKETQLLPRKYPKLQIIQQ